MKGLYFVLGAAIGGAVAWYLTKNHYKNIADEEINSVREKFEEDHKEMIKKSKEALDTGKKIVEEALNPILNKPDLHEYAEVIRRSGYSEKKKEEAKKPYVISHDEYVMDEREAVTLTLYSDGVLTDDDDQPIDDISAVVGECLDGFANLKESCIYVRNESRNVVYEVIKDEDEYGETHNDGPNPVVIKEEENGSEE